MGFILLGCFIKQSKTNPTPSIYLVLIDPRPLSTALGEGPGRGVDEVSAGSIAHMYIDQGRPGRGQLAVLLYSVTNKCEGKGALCIFVGAAGCRTMAKTCMHVGDGRGCTILQR